MSLDVSKQKSENSKLKSKTSKMKKIDNLGYIFVLPFLLTFVIFSLYPILKTFQLSFTNYNGYNEATFIGLENYKRLLQDVMFKSAFKNTLIMWGINITLQMGLAFILTLIFSDMKYKIKGLDKFRALYFLPNIIAATSVAVLFKELLDWRFGTINQMLLQSGLVKAPINWLGEPFAAQVAVALILSWMWFGNTFIILMAGVQGISDDYIEAARIDGAGRLTIFFKIILPLLKPILIYVSITSLIGGLQLFDIPFLMTGGQGNPQGALNTMSMYLFNTAFKYNNVGYAASIAYGLFFIIFIFSGINFLLMNKKERGVKNAK